MSGDFIAPALPLTGAELVMVAQLDPVSGQYRPRRVRLSDILAVGAAAQAARDAAQDAALGVEASARQSGEAGLAARAAAIEARPEEVAHFTASARLPTIAAAASVTLTLTGLVPARAGDGLRAGEIVAVEPASPLPPGLIKSTATVPADGTVAVQLYANLAVIPGAAPIVWNIAAAR